MAEPVTEVEESGADAEVQHLLQTLGTREEARPFPAMSDLIKLGGKVIEPTRTLMNDREQHFERRWQAAEILGVLKAKVAVPDLLAIIKGDDNALVTRVASWSLGETGDPALIPRLKRVLEDAPDPLIKKSLEGAIAVLEERDPVRVFPALTNLDFESGMREDGRPVGWGGGGVGYELSLDTEIFHQGTHSGRVKHIAGHGRAGSFMIETSAVPYQGKRIRYSGHLRTQDAGIAELVMLVDGPRGPLARDDMSDRLITGTTEWKEYEVVLDVSIYAAKIYFGFHLGGEGILWGDNLKIEVVGEIGTGPPVTGIGLSSQPQLTTDLSNLDFEAGTWLGGYPNAWQGGGDGYKISIDAEKVHQGAGSVRLERLFESGESVSLVRTIPAREFLNKRIKYTGFLSTESAESGVLWMRIDTIGRPDLEPIDFDDTAEEPLTGTFDWTERTIVLDVPEDAHFISLGLAATGAGIVWGDDLKIEVVGEIGQGPETTGLGRERMKAVNEANRERKTGN